MRKNASCLFNAMLIFFNIKMVPILSFKKILVCTVCGQELVKKKKKSTNMFYSIIKSTI